MKTSVFSTIKCKLYLCAWYIAGVVLMVVIIIVLFFSVEAVIVGAISVPHLA